MMTRCLLCLHAVIFETRVEFHALISAVESEKTIYGDEIYALQLRMIEI